MSLLRKLSKGKVNGAKEEENSDHSRTPSLSKRLRGLSSSARPISKIKEERTSIFGSMDSKSLLGAPNLLTYEAAIEKAVEVDSKKLNSLQKAVYDKDLKKTKKLIAESDRDIDKKDTEHDITSLLLAVR